MFFLEIIHQTKETQRLKYMITVMAGCCPADEGEELSNSRAERQAVLASRDSCAPRRCHTCRHAEADRRGALACSAAAQ